MSGVLKERMKRAVWMISGLVIGAGFLKGSITESDGRYLGELSIDQCRLVAESFLREYRSIKDSRRGYSIKGDEVVTLVSISDKNNCFFITESPSTNEARPWSTSFNQKGFLNYVYEHESYSDVFKVNDKDRVFLDLRQENKKEV